MHYSSTREPPTAVNVEAKRINAVLGCRPQQECKEITEMTIYYFILVQVSNDGLSALLM